MVAGWKEKKKAKKMAEAIQAERQRQLQEEEDERKRKLVEQEKERERIRRYNSHWRKTHLAQAAQRQKRWRDKKKGTMTKNATA